MNWKILYLVVAVTVSGLSMRAMASDVHPAIAQSLRQWSMGTGSLEQAYREFNDGSNSGLPAVLDSETGSIKAYRVDYANLHGRYAYDVRFDYAQGQTGYDGYIGRNSQTIPAKTMTNNRMVDIYTRHGMAFELGVRTALVPYIELGVSSWGRDIGMATPSRLTETFVHYAAGMGINGFYAPFDHLVIHVGGGIGHTIIPMTLVSESILKLGAKPYYTAAVGLDIRITQHLHVRADVDYRQWEYGRSDVEDDRVLGSIVEPRSETRRIRTLVSTGYGF